MCQCDEGSDATSVGRGQDSQYLLDKTINLFMNKEHILPRAVEKREIEDAQVN